MRSNPDLERAIREAGVAGLRTVLPGEVGKATRKRPRRLPPTSILLPDPARVAARHEVTIRDWHPTRLNRLKSAHWSAERRLKYSDACIIGGELRLAGVPAAWGKRRVGLVIVLGPCRRGGDCDAYWKSCLDGLVRCGALKDDNALWCELLPVRYERQSVASTRIILEDI